MGDQKNKIKYLSALVITIFLFFILPEFSLANKTYSQQKKKAVVFILDQISVKDLVEADTPNIDKLVRHGGFGIMNARPEAIINTNRASSYLTLGMGTRTTAPKRSSWRLNYISNNEWVIENIEEIKAGVKEQKLDKFGYIAKLSKKMGIKVALVGLNDPSLKTYKESALLVADEKGVLTYYSLDEFNKSTLAPVLNQNEILFIEFGETIRIQENNKDNDFAQKRQISQAIEEADQAIGIVIDLLGLKNNLFMVLTPNPSPESLKDMNLTLTPTVATNPLQPSEGWSILTSNSTKREGLITNLNFLPTLFQFFGLKNTGDVIDFMPVKENPYALMANKEKLYLNLNKTRYLLHGTYIFLIFFILSVLYSARLGFWKKEKFLNWFGLTILNIPLASLLMPLMVDYSRVFTGHLIIISSAFFITWLLRWLLRDFLLITSINSILTTTIILVDVFRGGNYLINTPFGFNDVIIGGRFYGINNDLMGILLGSALIGIFSIGQSLNLNKRVLGLVALALQSLIVLALSPVYGANVGGTISAAIILIISLLIILEFRLTIRRVIVITGIVLLGEIGVAALDAGLNENLTHAGKLYLAVKTNGLMVFYEMIKIKLSQIGLMLILPPWNIILLFEGYILWTTLRYKRIILEQFFCRYEYLEKGAKVTIVGATIIFLFNDTGVISSAIVLAFLLITLGYLLEFGGKEVKP